MNNINYWDPVEGTISADFFGNQLANIQKKIHFYKKNPHFIWIYFFVWLIPPVITFIILLVKFSITFDSMFIFYIASSPLVIYINSILGLQKNATIILLSEHHNWLYYPTAFHTFPRYEKLGQLFPEIFNQEITIHTEENIWGEYNSVPFWAFNFYLSQDTGKLRNSNNVSAIVVKLPKKISVPFILSSTRAFSVGKHITVELEELNHVFKIKPKEKDFDRVKLMNILNPSAQIALTELAENIPIWKIIFYEDMMLIQIDEQIIESKYKSFYKGMIVDKKVKKSIEDFIHNVVEFSESFNKFIH